MTAVMNKMGKLKCFEIVLSENKTVFHPGEKVVGQVIVELKGDMKMRSLRIFMRGVAKVHWTESRSTGSRLGSYTEHYNAEVEYFFKRQVLFGGGKTPRLNVVWMFHNLDLLHLILSRTAIGSFVSHYFSLLNAPSWFAASWLSVNKQSIYSLNL